jgi:hypothetical protein
MDTAMQTHDGSCKKKSASKTLVKNAKVLREKEETTLEAYKTAVAAHNEFMDRFQMKIAQLCMCLAAQETARRRVINKLLTGFSDDMSDYFDAMQSVSDSVDTFISRHMESSVFSVLPEEPTKFEFEHITVDLIDEPYFLPDLPLWTPLTEQYFDTVDDSDRLRHFVIDEIISTEQNYNNDIKILIQVFMEPCGRLGLLKPNEIDSVFGGIIDIAKFNHSLYTRLFQTVQPQLADGVQKFGHVFIEMAEFFKIYRKYITRDDNVVRSICSRKIFREFLRSCSSDVRCKKLDFSSFTIKPIQRLTKYGLFLADLKNKTPDQHPDHDNCVRAHASIVAIVKELNVDMLKSENEAKIFEYHTSLKNGGVNDFDLISSSRRLKLDAKIKLYAARDDKSGITVDALLCSDIFLLLKKSKRLFGNGLIVAKNIQLSSILCIIKREDVPYQPFSLNINCDIPSSGCIIGFDSNDQRDVWVSRIERELDKALVRDDARSHTESDLNNVDLNAPNVTPLRARSRSQTDTKLIDTNEPNNTPPLPPQLSTKSKPSHVTVGTFNLMPPILKEKNDEEQPDGQQTNQHNTNIDESATANTQQQKKKHTEPNFIKYRSNTAPAIVTMHTPPRPPRPGSAKFNNPVTGPSNVASMASSLAQ